MWQTYTIQPTSSELGVTLHLRQPAAKWRWEEWQNVRLFRCKQWMEENKMFFIYPWHSFLSLMGNPGITSDRLSGCRCRGGAGCCDVITLLGVDLCIVMVEAGVIRVSGPPTALLSALGVRLFYSWYLDINFCLVKPGRMSRARL